METVNSIAAAASKVIWGEPQETTDAANATIVPETKGTEPISGELGDTKKGEPYDLGNADSTTTQHTLSSISDGTTPTNTTTLSPPGLAAKPVDSSAVSPTPDSVSKTLAETHIAPLSSSTSNPTSETPLASNPLTSNPTNPNLSDTTPVENPLSTPTITTTEPLSEIARENDSSASARIVAAEKEKEKEIEKEKPSSTANAQGIPTDLQPLDVESEGTGEKHVKSSGVKAEGGGFDATRPGAGREADRLMGREGAATTGVGAAAVGGSAETGSEEEHGEGKKEGKLTHLKEKIKEKLHKH